MTQVRFVVVSALALAAWYPARGQSVVSTHSGTVYFFAGSVYIGGEKLEQKFGRFPDIGEGRELRTEQGRAEVILTPGVMLRVAEKSTIRMISNKLSDTRIELLAGSAILEATDAPKDTAVTLIHKNWQMRVPRQGVYRIDAEPAKLQVYKGQVEVSAIAPKSGDTSAPTVVKEGETLPLAEVLVADKGADAPDDSFKTWAMNRSQAVAADNATAAEIIDDPSQFDTVAGLDMGGGFTYFPMTGVPSLGIGNPYGLSFWSPYQMTLTSMWSPTYLYGPYGPVFSGLHAGWPTGLRSHPTSPIYIPRPVRVGPVGTTVRPGAPPVHVYVPPTVYTHGPVTGGGAHVGGGHR